MTGLAKANLEATEDQITHTSYRWLYKVRLAAPRNRYPGHPRREILADAPQKTLSAPNSVNRDQPNRASPGAHLASPANIRLPLANKDYLAEREGAIVLGE